MQTDMNVGVGGGICYDGGYEVALGDTPLGNEISNLDQGWLSIVIMTTIIQPPFISCRFLNVEITAPRSR